MPNSNSDSSTLRGDTRCDDDTTARERLPVGLAGVALTLDLETALEPALGTALLIDRSVFKLCFLKTLEIYRQFIAILFRLQAELNKRGYPDILSVGSLAGAGTLGLLIPPSIIMIVYGVTADVSISQLFIGGVIPGILLALILMACIAVWSPRNQALIPPADAPTSLREKLYESPNLIPLVLLIGAVLGSIYTGIATATATEAASLGVVGSLILSTLQGSMTWATFKAALMGGTRLYCMIALILAGAAS